MKISLPLNIEIPSNPTDFNLGLMFRESLDQNSGMLFVFEETGQKSFHMKDTKIPLDIAFIEENGTIESIKELLPLSVIPISSDGQVLYALEVNRGWFKENNIEVGDNIFESDLASRKKELRLRQIDQQKKWRPNTTSIQRAREKEQMKKEIKQELSQQESVTIENSDGVTFARIMDIVGPAQMKPVVNSDGVWKGTEVVEGVGAIAGGAAKVALGGAAVAGKVAVKGAKFAGKTAAYLGKKAGNRIGKELVKATSDVDNNADKEFDKVKVKRYKETPVKEQMETGCGSDITNKGKKKVNPKKNPVIEAMETDDGGPGTGDQQQKQIDSKQKKADQIKKQVLLKKLQAVRQGGGSDIMASYDWRSDKSMRINKLLNN
mgnify:FL=1|tara:strand:+ start:2739 stop:3869 length:1131 start_codon:yes stop_codon:yes gene_type:complete